MIRTFRIVALSGLAWAVAVIVWGAFVRATGSGAGCGDHWPMCNGVLLPRAPRLQTVIELTHRLTSGLALLSVVATVLVARRAFAPGHPARRWAVWSLLLMLTEALLGALLVKAELVANNATASRALAMGLHLINTFALVAAMTRCAFHGFSAAPLSWARRDARLALVAAATVLAVGVSGATAALGDTLSQQQVFSPLVELLIGLRLIHPLLAVVSAVVLVGVGSLALRGPPLSQRWGAALIALLVLQLVVGVSNVALQAPVWIQLVHLGLADAVWVVLWVLALSLATRPSEAPLGELSAWPEMR